jgi:hypothetical protein
MISITGKELMEKYQVYLSNSQTTTGLFIDSALDFLRHQPMVFNRDHAIEKLDKTPKRYLLPFSKFLKEEFVPSAEINNNLSKDFKLTVDPVVTFIGQHPTIEPILKMNEVFNNVISFLLKIEDTEKVINKIKLNATLRYEMNLVVTFLGWLMSSEKVSESWRAENNISTDKIGKLIYSLDSFERIKFEKSNPTKEELKSMVDLFPDQEGKVILSLLVLEGLKETEILLIKFDDIKVSTRRISLTTIEVAFIERETLAALDGFIKGKNFKSGDLLFQDYTISEINKVLRKGLDLIGRTELTCNRLLYQLARTNFHKSGETRKRETKPKPVEKVKRKTGRPNLELREKINLT